MKLSSAPLPSMPTADRQIALSLRVALYPSKLRSLQGESSGWFGRVATC